MTTAPASPFSVLLVEDEPVQRTNAAEALREAGLGVVEASGISGAVDALDRCLDLRAVVIDVELVGENMDGFTLARAVAARWPEVAIVVVSGIRTPIEGQLPAGSRFLSKPYDARELAKTVFLLVDLRAEGLQRPSELP